MAERWLRLRSMVEKPLQRRGLLTTRHLRLPDFLGIGAQKAGTTWLHDQLARHPGIMLPEEKEQHYFDWSFHRPLADYARVFATAETRICGEITPGYAILPQERIDFIAAVMPLVRVIMLLRDPIERAWSQMVMNLTELPKRDPSLIPLDEWIAAAREPRVAMRSGYLATLDAWGRRVPADRFFLGFFEEIASDPDALLAKIHVFLGVDALPAAGGERRSVVRKGLGLPMPLAVREELVRMLRPELEGLASRFGGPATAWLSRWTP